MVGPDRGVPEQRDERPGMVQGAGNRNSDVLPLGKALYHRSHPAAQPPGRHTSRNPFVRPAFDVRKDEAYQIMKNILKDELLK